MFLKMFLKIGKMKEQNAEQTKVEVQKQSRNDDSVMHWMDLLIGYRNSLKVQSSFCKCN